jgi:hypothetical protein
MNRIVLSALLLGVLASGSRLAQADEMCKAICSAEKRECRSAAGRPTEDDPMFPMGGKNPLAREAGDPRAGSGQTRPGAMNAFRNRRSERFGACDDKHLRCSRQCASGEPAATRASGLVKPELKR